MEFILNIKKILEGSKTYLVAVGAIISALLAYLAGTMDIVATAQAIFAAVAVMTMRGAVSSNGPSE